MTKAEIEKKLKKTIKDEVKKAWADPEIRDEFMDDFETYVHCWASTCDMRLHEKNPIIKEILTEMEVEEK